MWLALILLTREKDDINEDVRYVIVIATGEKDDRYESLWYMWLIDELDEKKRKNKTE